MTPAEYRLLVLALAWILASVPLALLVFQVWCRPRPVHPVIPHEDAAPAGSFLDVSLPAPDVEPAESGLSVRHWKRVDGWVALIVVLVLSVLMGPLSMSPEGIPDFRISPKLMLMQLGFQLGLAGLILFYLSAARGFQPAVLFGLKRHIWWRVPLLAIMWMIPGIFAVGFLNYITMPWLLELLGQTEASSQLMVEALQKSPDDLTKLTVALTVGIGAPFMEEIVFRGFLYGVAKRFTHWSYAALGTSLFFGIVHGNAMSLLPLTLLGLLFTTAYERSKNLLVPMAMHSLFNLTQIAILFHVPQLVPSS